MIFSMLTACVLMLKQVENTLYNLHASLWIDISGTLKNMFDCPPGEGNIREGLNDESPIRLPQPVTVERFDHLLEWFYTQ